MIIVSWLVAISAFFLPFMQALTINIKFPLKIYEITLVLAVICYFVRLRFDIPNAIKIIAVHLLAFCVYCTVVLVYRHYNPSFGFDPAMVFTRFSPFLDSVTKMMYVTFNVVGFTSFGWLAYKRPKMFLEFWLWGAVTSGLYSIYLASSTFFQLPTLLLPGMDDPQKFNDYIIRCGTFLEGNYAGLFYLISLTLAMYAKHYKKAAILAVATFSTLSTTALALLFFVLLLELLRFSKYLETGTKITLTVIGIAVVCVTLTLFVSTPVGYNLLVEKIVSTDDKVGADSVAYSRQDRIDTAMAAIQLYSINPLIGVGISQFPYYYNTFSKRFNPLTLEEDRVIPNNVYAEILGETGLIGGIFFIVFFIMLYIFSRQPNSYSLNVGLVLILLFWLSFPTFSVMYVWAFWGGVVGLAQWQRELKKQPQNPNRWGGIRKHGNLGVRVSELPPLRPLKIMGILATILAVVIGIFLWRDFFPDSLSSDSKYVSSAKSDLVMGMNGHPTEQEVYRQIPLDEQYALLKELGIQWYRCDWADYPTFEQTDAIVSKAAEQGITILPVLFPPVDIDQEDDTQKIYKESFDYAVKWVKRYRSQIHVWELHNELDVYSMLKMGEKDAKGSIWRWGAADGSSIDHYQPERIQKSLAILKGLSEGVRSADPQAKRIINTGGWKHYGFLKFIKGEGIDYEILGWHWYSEMGDITNAKGTDVLKELESYYKEIWITEGNSRQGIAGRGGVDHSQYLRNTLRQIQRLYPRVKAYFVYELFDEPHLGWWNHESQYGIVSVKMGKSNKWEVDSRKPQFYAIQEVIKPATTP